MDRTDTPAKVASTDELGHLPERPASLNFVPYWYGGEPLYTTSQTLAYGTACAAAERERWRGIAHRVAADANRYGCEGLHMRCTISESGGLVSWEVDRALLPKRENSCKEYLRYRKRCTRLKALKQQTR